MFRGGRQFVSQAWGDDAASTSREGEDNFDIVGNHHRFITAIHYNTRSIFIPKILTHAYSSKDRWENDR